ncbi:MAG: NapC/NirT family cytochrome c [Gemmatimonadota bacterium]
MEPDPPKTARRGRIASWIGRLSLPALAVLGVVLVSAVGTGSYYAYRTYDFVEHDNEFCLSCHLMADPYERFAQSAHQDLGCKDCHQPSLIERSRMGLSQFVENPDEISAHAEVPNDLCASCHIEGDPERWRSVAATAGHRVHLESDDPALEGLQCVECHASSLHEFAAVDRTCAQSGCHTDSGIQLGGMSDLTIHCAACHGFNTALDRSGGEVALAALAPDENTCLSCHAMQAMATMPEDDPHEGTCASCHNPHVQATPEEASSSCATAGCHTDAEALTPFHRGLDEDVAADCMYCHQAHDFRVDGDNCVACHVDIFDDADAGLLGAVHASRGAGFAVHQPQEPPGFLHSEHRDVDCASCHASEPVHGALTVTTVADCRSCHHSEPVATDCVACHAEPGGSGAAVEVRRTLSLSVGERPGRALPFDHGTHEGETCSTCHAEGPTRSAAQVDCASCHEPHHDAAVDCASCHVPAAPGAHSVDTAHLGCGGSGCHQDLPFEQVERSRTVCLVCHQDLWDHRPEGDCAECHAMTGPGFTGADR